MILKAVRVSLAVLLVSCATLQLPGCANETGKGTSGTKASLVVTFFPNPAPYEKPGEWRVTVLVSEVRGVGVRIYGYTFDEYSIAGEFIGSSDKEEAEFEAFFNGCDGGEENYLSGGTTRCGGYIFDERESARSIVVTFFGVDDFGNEVEGSGRVDLI